MTVERIVLLFVGAVVAASAVLAQVHNPNWLWLAFAMGLNLVQMAFTGFCPMAAIAKALGARPGAVFARGESGRA
ncbi:sulfurtransferase [Rhodothalassium salexigens]|uniref:YgaP family membrane protein n=1 Tax=Rhodothalassium salexigens TaxID=1086 RepID=UPI0019142B44|nr:DUF2892 domain-containing protein [Rhodothalassium salexigens]MBK5912079.1 sulfurtransferase [Rhodothalassium salexigens]MBK5921163.1 sulfurtransferase [Rhodothalassium salexigens]